MLYAQLGELLQARDVRFHEGGSMQPKALEAYEKALSFDLNDDLVDLPCMHIEILTS